ncbi:hypothetical protein D3C86_1903670 [compost metagenome]
MVAPTASAARRVKMATSALLLNSKYELPAITGLFIESSSHSPLPSLLKRAANSVPLSRYLSPAARRLAGLASFGSHFASDTNL